MINNISRTVSYRVLELEGSALEEEIKKAYRRLVMKWHPDKNPDNPDAEKRFMEIQQAYDYLLKEERTPDQITEDQLDNDFISSVHDHPMQSLREMAVKYYADRGWFKNGYSKK